MFQVYFLLVLKIILVLRCSECRKSLDGVPFAVNDAEQVFCMKDYERIYVPICARCQQPIKPSNVSVSLFLKSFGCLENLWKSLVLGTLNNL